MIDLHTHILPGVDDGVKTEEEAVAFARMAVEDGTRLLVATPHCREGSWFNDRAEVLERVAELRERLSREEIPLQLEPGAEVHLCPDLADRVRDGRAPTLGDNGKTLLLELSLTQYPIDLENLVFQLKLEGIETLFAHPERIRFFQDDISRYEAVVRLGAWGQITTGSVTGQFGRTAKAFSEEVLRKGLVHVLASDSHNLRGRPPLLSEARAAMVPMIGEERAQAMCEEAPRALLDGKHPELPPVENLPARRRSIFVRWFGRGLGEDG
jgi:protein-tyrosine phosphatase